MHFFIAVTSEEAITIFVTTVGKRIEIYVSQDGSVDFSVFRGREDVTTGVKALEAELDAD